MLPIHLCTYPLHGNFGETPVNTMSSRYTFNVYVSTSPRSTCMSLRLLYSSNLPMHICSLNLGQQMAVSHGPCVIVTKVESQLVRVTAAPTTPAYHLCAEVLTVHPLGAWQQSSCGGGDTLQHGPPDCRPWLPPMACTTVAPHHVLWLFHCLGALERQLYCWIELELVRRVACHQDGMATALCARSALHSVGLARQTGIRTHKIWQLCSPKLGYSS